MVSRKGSDESASSCAFVYHDSLAVAVPLADRAVKRWEPSAVVHVEHEQQNNSKTSEQQQANVRILVEQ